MFLAYSKYTEIFGFYLSAVLQRFGYCNLYPVTGNFYSRKEKKKSNPVKACTLPLSFPKRESVWQGLKKE